MQRQQKREVSAARFWKIRVSSSLILLSSLFLSFLFGGKAYAASVTPVAIAAYGQLVGSFTTNTVNLGGISAVSLNQPSAVMVDSSGGIYVSDTGNNRVLYYPSGATTASRVYGQGGSFTSNTANNGGISANSLNGPTGLVLDSSGNLYIADSNNNRILGYTPGSTTATGVYGQGGSFTTNTVNKGGISATSLNYPTGMVRDSSNNLYVADTNNNRILYFAAGSATATGVIGQGGSLTNNTANNGGISTTSVDGPTGLALDSSSDLYVADTLNNRVLYYASGSNGVASRVIGQGGVFTTNTANKGGISATSLSQPRGIALDSSNDLYVADSLNNRVLYYASGSTTATGLDGQGSSFTSNTANNGGISATSLYQPYAVALTSSNTLYTADYANNRTLYYSTNSTATTVYGQEVNSFTTNTANNGGISASGLDNPTGITTDSSGGLYVADTTNNRVLYYPSGSTTATRVYGQGGSFTSNTANNGGISTTSLNQPYGVAVDSSGNLYVADGGNNRVLYYAAGSTTATRVYGQGGSFTSNTANNGGISATSLSGPSTIALDSSGNLYVNDKVNNRVLYYAAGSTTATRVYGQGGSFTSNTANNGGISATGLSGPVGVAVDSAGDVAVADATNNRVLYYAAGSTTATRVYGQGGSFTTATTGVTNSSSFDNQAAYVSFDSSGDLYASDFTGNRILKFQTALMVSTQPSSSVIVNNTFTVTFGLYDVGSGSAYSDMTGSATVAIKAGTGAAGATLGGTTTVTASGGYATFSTLTLDTVGNNYVLTGSTTSYGTANTNSFNAVGVLTETVSSSTSTWSVALTGRDQTKTYTLPAVSVVDSTATGNGWHLTITSTQFTTSGGTVHTLAATASSITSVNAVCASGNCTMPTTNVSYPMTIPAASTAPTAISFYNATATTGKGQFTVTPTVSVAIPGNAYSGTYTSTMTIAIISGP